jgi:rhamnose transport system permease protein
MSITFPKPLKPMPSPFSAPSYGALFRIQPTQIALLGMLAIEFALFSAIGENFQTWGNLFEILRLIVELGLLALALTPVIVTGGIDLSVGSLLGLCAIAMGILWQDAQLSLWLAAPIAILLGGAGGMLNALLITRLRIPPLMVTLGSMLLFRGLAQGLTRGARNFTDFPAAFQFLGQGFIGPVPAQALLFVLAAIGFWILLHRSTIGRALSAIGYSRDGARHAGIPVERRVALTYVLAGLAAGIAGILYSARLNQAKADAGTGYELEAITAVVLGGTSIFGGRGSVGGTLMGLIVIAMLKRGLYLSQLPPEAVGAISDLIHALPSWLGGSLLASGESINPSLPAELATILTGVLLLAAIIFDFKPGRTTAVAKAAAASQSGNEEFDMKNSHVAVLSVVILLAAALIAGSNLMLVHSITQHGLTGAPPAPAAHKLVIGMMPKSKGNSYFISCREGAEAAAKDLNVELIWDGPTDPDPAKQSEVVEAWITRGVDVIAVACENGQGIASVLKKARDKGIKVITWDADTKPDARDFFVTQAMPDDMGHTLIDNAANVMHNKGKFAIITASLTAENMIAWQAAIEKYRKLNYPDMEMVALKPCDDKQDEARKQATEILTNYPDVKVLLAICSPAAPGAAEAVKLLNRTDVKVVGVSLPNINKTYVHDGVTDDIVLWDTKALGYLTVQVACDMKSGKLRAGDKTFDAGKLGVKEIDGSNIILGKPMTFTKENIDQYNF